jgi:hypothetical protein
VIKYYNVSYRVISSYHIISISYHTNIISYQNKMRKIISDNKWLDIINNESIFNYLDTKVLRIKQIIIELFHSIIEANSSRLLILVLESFQWIDPASLEILYSLCEVSIYSLCEVSLYSLCEVSLYSLCEVSIYNLCEVSIYSLCEVSIYRLCEVIYLLNISI